MQEPDKDASLERLSENIKKLREQTSPAAKETTQAKGFGFALQVGLELMSGAFVGVALGYFLDKWLNTSPIFLILCFFLGSGGGFLTVVRALNKVKGGEE